MDKSGISFRPSMLGKELANSISSLNGSLKTYVNEVRIEGDEFVVHLRKPSFFEKIQIALMPASMKQERMFVLNDVIRQAAAKAGVDGDELLASISSGQIRQAHHAIRDAGVRVALKNSVHHDLF